MLQYLSGSEQIGAPSVFCAKLEARNYYRGETCLGAFNGSGIALTSESFLTQAIVARSTSTFNTTAAKSDLPCCRMMDLGKEAPLLRLVRPGSPCDYKKLTLLGYIAYAYQ